MLFPISDVLGVSVEYLELGENIPNILPLDSDEPPFEFSKHPHICQNITDFLIDSELTHALELGATNYHALLNAFKNLNTIGQEKAVERVEELTEIPKYQRDPDKQEQD